MQTYSKAMTGLRLKLGVGLALFYGLVLYLMFWTDHGVIMFLSGLILTPMAIASIFSAAADPLGRAPVSRHLKYVLLVMLGLLGLSVIFFKEGGICVAMASPFMLVGGIMGSTLTVKMLRNRSMRAGPPLMIVLPLLMGAVEPHMDFATVQEQVVSVIEIDAPPSVVWAQTVEIRNIEASELKPTFSHAVIGTPKPLDARMEGQGIGAVRQLQWTQGVTFEEVVTDWQQDRKLAWDFRFTQASIPDHVEAHIDVDSGYLKIANGDYVLEALPDNRTRLTLTTRYQMATPINAYCKLWGKVFFNDFHTTVLKVVKDRSERLA